MNKNFNGSDLNNDNQDNSNSWSSLRFYVMKNIETLVEKINKVDEDMVNLKIEYNNNLSEVKRYIQEKLNSLEKNLIETTTKEKIVVGIFMLTVNLVVPAIMAGIVTWFMSK